MEHCVVQKPVLISGEVNHRLEHRDDGLHVIPWDWLALSSLMSSPASRFSCRGYTKLLQSLQLGDYFLGLQ